MKAYLNSILTALLAGAAKSSSVTEESFHQRRTAIGDFDEFNELFKDASIYLPDEFEVNERVGIANLVMTIKNMVCFDVAVGDVAISHQRLNSQNIDVLVDIHNLDLKCEMEYDYQYGILRGDGWVHLNTADSSASTNLRFASSNFDKFPPSDSSVDSCVADVEIVNMDFEGDFVSEILETFQRLIRGVVEREVGEVACEELGSLGTSLVSNVLGIAKDKLEPYEGALHAEFSDPLHLEKTIDLPANLAALDLWDSDSTVTNMFLQALEGVDLFLGAMVSDDSGATTTGEDLAVNVFMRSYLLDSNRAFTLTADQLPLSSLVVFQGHDRLFETTMTLNQVKLFGLDTMSRFNPFVEIGSYTVQNELTWDRLTVEFDVTVEIKPSALEDSILQHPSSTGVTENIMIDFGVDNVDVLASLLLVLDENAMGSIQLGSLLNTEDFIPCLLSVVQEAQLAGLEVDPKVVNEPTLNGFISPGLDRIITDSAEAAFAMYTGVLRESLPSIFQTTVRDFLNAHVIDAYMSEYANTQCATVPSSDGYIDFNEFFGDTNKFGDVPPMLRTLLDTELLTADSATGNLRINQALIAPFTGRQSGTEGDLQFKGDVFGLLLESIPQFGMDILQLKAFDPSLQNLDTFVAPVSLLEPNATNGHILDNALTLSSQEESLHFGLKGLLALKGDPVLTMHNEIDLTVDLGGSEIFAAVLAKMDANGFLEFPLRDVVNADCWLATLASPLLDEHGDILLGSETGLSLQSLLTNVPSMDINMACSNCSSSGLLVLPEVLKTLDEGGVTDALERRLVDLGLEFVRSEYAQASLNRLLADSSLRCPHSSNYIGPEASSLYPVPQLPSLSYDALETIAFASSLFMNMAAVIVAESHSSYDVEETNALSGQSKLNNTSEARLVDFSNLDSSVGEWANPAKDQFVTYLNTIIADPKGPNGKDLRINHALRNTILNEFGFLDVNFHDLSFGHQDTEVSLKHIRVVGLDTITSVDIMEALSPQTLQNKLTFKKLGLEVVVSLMGTSGASGRNLKSMDDITMYVEVGDVEISSALLLAMDLDMLGSLQLSSFLALKNVVPCLLSAARAAELTELQVAVGSIETISVTGFRAQELNNAAAESSRVILQNYGDAILSSMPGFFDLTVRALVNNWMTYYMGEWSNVACPTSDFAFTDFSSLLDLRDLLLPAAESVLLGGGGAEPYGDFFRTAFGFLKELIFKVDTASGLSAVNDILIGPMTRDQSRKTGSLIFPGDLLSGGTELEVGQLDATVQFRVSDARIENLDTVGSPLEFLQNIHDPFKLNNMATFGVRDRPLRGAVRVFLLFEGDDHITVENELDITVDLSSASVFLETMLKVAEARFYDFPLRDALDYNCWLATMPAPELDRQGVRMEGTEASASLAELSASIAQLNLNVTCVHCTSPRMYELTELLSIPEAQQDITTAANDFLAYASDLMGGTFLQVQIDRQLFEASRKCPHSPQYDPQFEAAVFEEFAEPDNENSVSNLVMLGALVTTLILLVALLVLMVRCIVQRRHKKWLGQLPPHQVRRLAVRQGKEQDLQNTLNASTQSMFTSQDIPKFVRWSMPLIILGNIAFFLSGHLSIGGTVNVEAEIAGQDLKVEKFFDFSIASSTIDIWKAGGRHLAIMIFLFSGVWPYTKQFTTLYLWFVPPSRVSVARRGSILMWLDWLAKWSMVDVFVLVISIAAFRVSIQSPAVSFLPTDFYSVDMMVVPLWGLYANMIAQLISQVSSHFIIHYHRQIVHRAEKSVKSQRQGGVEGRAALPSPENSAEKGMVEVSVDVSLDSDQDLVDTVQRKALGNHQFSRPHRGETETLVARSGVNAMLWVAAFCLVVFVVIGCAIPSFSLELLGLVGVAVEAGQEFESATTSHSIFSVLQLLFEEARFLGTAKDFIGLGSLSMIMLVSVLLIPTIQSLALLHQWFSPATRSKRARMAIFIETLQAWQYAEVYLVAVFVASWQLGPVSDFMINSYCDNLKDTFAQLVYYGVLKESDAQCFSVHSSIEGGSFVLAAGAVILALFNTFVNKAVVQYFRDKDEYDKRAQVEEVDPEKSDSALTFNTDEEYDHSDGGFTARIHPVPVLFTDTFRWLLRPDSNLASSSRAMFANNNEHWSLPEAEAVPFDDDLDARAIEGHYVDDVKASGSKRDMQSKSSSPHSASMSKSSKSSVKPRYPAAARRLTYEGDDQSSSMPSSMLDAESQSIRSATPRGNLKDDRTYATPPQGYLDAAPSVTSAPTTPPVAVSVSESMVSTPRTRQPSSHADLTMEEEQTVEELLQEDDEFFEEIVTASGDDSEYVEETVDGFEEYTVESLSNVPEEDVSTVGSRSHRIV